MKVAAYIRVSTDKEEQKLSFEHQRTMLERYAKEHGDELVGVYADATVIIGLNQQSLGVQGVAPV